MSNENTINMPEGRQLLESIFKVSQNGQFSISPILNDSSNITNLILFLKDKKINIIEKAEIIYILYQVFNANSVIIPLFMKNRITKIVNLYEPLIDLYLTKDEYIYEYKALFEKLIKMIRNNITLTKAPLEYIYQKLSFYFENKVDEKERLNENQILKYLNILKIFYTGGIKENNIFEKNNFSLDINNNTNQNIKEIKNYIYFNGVGSSISLELNNNSTNPNSNFPTLQYGLSFIMWIYIDENLIKKYQEINNKTEIQLVLINISGEQIKLILKDIFTLQVLLNDSEFKNFETKLIKINDWNNICFSILEKNANKLQFTVFINSVENTQKLTVSKNFPVSSKISTIKLFGNFIGKVSSFMIVTKGLNSTEAEYFSKTIKYGFYKNKVLFDFLLSNDNKYFINCKNYKYYEKCKCKTTKSISFYDLNAKKQNIKNMIAIFCPFAYNKEDNKIDDIFGNFIGVLGENDGVNFFMNNSKTIRQLGGLNNLLPLIELMFSTISKSKKSKYNLIDKSILTQSTFYECLNLIKQIIIGHSQNLSDLNKSKFFSSLSLFIEKFPSHLFTPKILQILLEIGKETFHNIDKLYRGENYINLILLNEKIISKYNSENQLILWKNIYSFFTSDDTQIKDCFNIRKICLLLRLYDEKRYNKYCCKKHADIFKDNIEGETGETPESEYSYDMEIMEPEMHVRLDELFKIIQIYVDKLCEEEQTLNLFQLLSLDLSPCLQKKIIQVYINYFENKKIDLSVKLKSFDVLVKNNFIELIEYVFSISLLDIRFDILILFKIFLDNKELKARFQNYMGIEDNGMNNFYIFISENLLPEQLYAEINKNKNEEETPDIDTNLKKNNSIKNNAKELFPLTNYFNKRIYEKEIDNIWNILSKWMLYKVSPPSSTGSKKKDKEFTSIHNFIIDFCISFVSKSPFNYIDLFILTIISNFKTETINNREILYTNKNLYPWLIETIYYFHNSEINDYVYKKEDILSIKKNSIDLFEEFFVHRRPHDEVNQRIYYIIKYSIHLKKIYGNTNNKKITEITRITRLLLQKIMDVSSINMNYKAKACFDFILFHKNFSQLTGLKKHITHTNLNRYSINNYLRQSSTMKGSNFNLDFNNTNSKSKFSVNNNKLFLDTIDEDKKEKSNDDFNNRKNSNSFQLLDLEETPKEKEEEKGNNFYFNKTDIIPSYIFESLHCNNLEDYDSEEEEKTKKGNNLKILWEDFNLYDSIIDYYSSNIWGTENLRKKVKIDVDMNLMTLCKNLLKEYGETKSYRNILLKDILKCLNIKYSDEDSKKEKVKINILNINVILLCIAIEISKDLDEMVFLEGKFHQFIIFCILVSININSNAPYYDLIQENLYDSLGFAFMFLKKKDFIKYNQFVDSLITPIIDLDEVKKLRIFKNKKYNNKNSAIFKLFEIREKKKEDPEEMHDLINDKNIPSRKTYNINYKINDKDFISKDKVTKDDSTVNAKKNNNYKVIFKGETDLILKHLFEDNLNKIKEEKKYHFGFKTNYKNVYNNNLYYTGTSPSDEKLRINKILKKVLPLYETSIKNYANDEYLLEKRKRNFYKSHKSKLFSWKGFWSNKYLFYEHPELLKLKIRNHYTKEMTKPLLVPILDIDYYTPPFKKFDKTKLFNDNNYKYKINLDIDDILLDEVEDENNKNSIIIENEEFESKKNKYGFNFLESLYKLPYNDIWDKIKNYSKQKIIFDKLISLNKEPYSTLINSKKMSKNIENIQRENIYNCCIVKLTHHIKGYISTEKTRIRFIFESDSNKKIEELENDSNYDKEMKCCFGSIFKNKRNDKDKVVISIDYLNIKYIFVRQYFYVESALEIFTDYNKSYFFNFKSNRDLIQFKSDIIHHGTFREIKTEDFKGKKILGYQQINPNSKKKIYYVNNKMEEWQNNYISTLEYLMWLNIYSGRSFNDLTQYPVFPWIITNYLDDSKEITKDDLRNLNMPIGMLDLNEKGELRKETFIETYQTLKNDLKEMIPDFIYQEYLKKGDEYLESYRSKKMKNQKDNQEEITNLEYNQIPYFYGSHYSNPTYVAHFLTRIFPFTYVSIEIQGERFDDPDRMFTSMMKTFESTSTLKDDVRELIPEFYMLPELFLNRNNLNLAQNRLDDNNNLIIINDVKLPLWSNNNPINFVIKLRRYLETNYINSNINKWIDLIFGLNQKGEKAEENRNIFQAHTYEKNVKIDSITDNDSRNALMRQYEMGVTPFQLFETESKNKIKNTQNITLDESKNLIFKTMNSKTFEHLKNKKYDNHKLSNDKMYKHENITLSFLKIVKIAFIENDRIIKIFTNNNHWYTIKIEEELSNNSKTLKIDENKANKFKNNSNRYACSYFISDIETPIIIYNDNQNILKGGFWDGRLELNILSLDNKEDQSIQVQTIFNPDFSPITTMKMSKNEKFLLCGTKDGNVIAYKLNEKNIEYKKTLYLFDDEIISISLNENLNMFAASSRDGFINLHILPSYKLVRTICLNKNQKENEKNNILYANNIFLSNSPLPCLVLYINSKRLFKSYTINGEFICEINETDNSSKIKCPIIYTNNNFQDILLYGTNDGFIKIRKFPEMTLINSISVFPEKEINTISLSQDKKYCYVWSSGSTIALIKEDSKIENNNIKEEVDII